MLHLSTKTILHGAVMHLALTHSWQRRCLNALLGIRSWTVLPFSKLNKLLFGYFDPEKMFENYFRVSG